MPGEGAVMNGSTKALRCCVERGAEVAALGLDRLSSM